MQIAGTAGVSEAFCMANCCNSAADGNPSLNIRLKGGLIVAERFDFPELHLLRTPQVDRLH